MGNAATPAPTEPRRQPLRHESRAFSRWRKRMRGTAQDRPRPEHRRQKCPVPLLRAASNISTRIPTDAVGNEIGAAGNDAKVASIDTTAAHPITVIRLITCSTSLAFRTYPRRRLVSNAESSGVRT